MRDRAGSIFDEAGLQAADDGAQVDNQQHADSHHANGQQRLSDAVSQVSQGDRRGEVIECDVPDDSIAYFESSCAITSVA